MDFTLHALTIFGTVVFAASGAIAAAEHKFDLVGAVFLSVAAALGGGTIVAILVDQPVRWLNAAEFLWVPLITALLIFEALRHFSVPDKMLVWADAAGLALFTATGMKSLLALQLDPAVTVFLSSIGAAGGGIIRDVLANRPPLVFSGEIYVTAVILGSLAYLGCNLAGMPEWTCLAASMAVAFVLRGAGITFQITLREGRIKSQLPM